MKFSKRKVMGKIPCFPVCINYKLDFMALSNDNIIYGIEVKIEKGDPKSLKNFLDKKLIDKGILAGNTIGGRNEKFDTILIFTVGARLPYKYLVLFIV